MTRDQAINAATAWWCRKFRDGCTWDNGDSQTELALAMYGSLLPRPPREALQNLEAIIRPVVEATQFGDGWYLYCDYGCHYLDVAFRQAGIRLVTIFHGPQKAGTQICRSRDSDDHTVTAKDGYSGDWYEIDETGQRADPAPRSTAE